MRRALLVAALAVGLGAMALTRSAPPALAPPERESAPMPPPPPAPTPALSRNPFEFGSRPTEPALSPAPSSAASQDVLPTVAPPSPVRLVGFVERGQSLRAALVVDGETVLLAVGETAMGYTLVAADLSEGVRLTGPDGAELRLPVAE